MSMKCVGCLKHIPTHATSENPRELPTATLTVRPSIYQVGVASLWPLATVAGAKTHYICIYQSFYDYEVCGVSQNIPTHHATSEKLRELPTAILTVNVRPSIYQVGVASLWPLACWNTLYMYRAVLLWVWSVWDVSNISHIPTTSEKPRELPTATSVCETRHIRLVLHPHDHWQ
jgi:hypothetical protein